MEQIRGRWNVSADKMSKKHIDYLLKNNRNIVNNITDRFFYLNFDLDVDRLEIYNVVLEGLYKAIQSYNDKKGSLTTYAYFYCKGHLNYYIKKNYLSKKKINEIPISEYYENDDYEKMENKILLNQLAKELNEEDKMILESFSNSVPDAEAARECNCRSTFIYKNRLANIINLMRQRAD